MLCCQIERNDILDLPFISNLVWDFYDGPLEGIITCNICNQGYYYRCICDEHTQDSLGRDETFSWYCRIFQFFAIDYNNVSIVEHYGLDDSFSKGYRWCPLDMNETGELWSKLQTTPVSHICASDAYIQKGLWRKVVPQDMNVKDWYDYLGITIDKEARCFRTELPSTTLPLKAITITT